jgi:murein DD-endopeptidase MepM/ murein hydrolase activator NlpD
LYAHITQKSVKVGVPVKAREQTGEIGNTYDYMNHPKLQLHDVNSDD